MAAKKDEEKVAVPEYGQFELLLQKDFANMARLRHNHKALVAELEKKIRELDDQLNPLMEAVGRSSVRVGNLTVKQVYSTSPSKLDKQMLLEHGVAVDVIAECTVPGKPYSYVQTVEDKVK